MQIEENRNCNCNDNMPNNAMGMQMPNMYNWNNDDNDCEDDRRIDCETKKKLLHKIMAYDFGINELALYLDTHSDDERALCLHNRYCKEVKELNDKYQKVYGPLTIEYPCNKWRWLEEPWPWERGNS